MVSHLKITQAGLTALATTIVGQLIAFVPSFAPDKQILISAASTTIAALFLLANAIHHLADSNPTLEDIKAGALDYIHQELGRIDYSHLIQQALAGGTNLDALIRTELQRILTGATTTQSASEPAAGPSPPAAPTTT